ncbi:MAG: hypothetical protein HY000_02170 [Planctomycetes bacterium]|nr:hypothetical protein [Planctomycetia bacterium]MBI3461853.1 hypothetical protein [Planctomycetota bacterium]
MPPLRDPQLLRCYKNALANWRFTGFVTFSAVALSWIRKNLPGHTYWTIAQIMQEFVAAGGEIDQQRETRPEWRDHNYHYDLRIPIGGRLIYIETRLEVDDPDDDEGSIIEAVNIHEA